MRWHVEFGSRPPRHAHAWGHGPKPCRLSKADSVRLYADSLRLYFNVSLDFYTLDSRAALWRRFFLEIRGHRIPDPPQFRQFPQGPIGA